MARNIGRNEPCPCGSGKKYKFCCIGKEIQKRLIKTGEACDSCGIELIVDLTSDPLFQVFNYQRPLKEFFKDNGLYMFGFFSFKEETEMLDLLKEGALTKPMIFEIYKGRMKKGPVMAILNDACEDYETFNKRRQILIEAFEAHFDGKYSLSINSFFSILEGILREIGNLAFKDKFRSTISVDVWENWFAFEVKDNARDFNNFINRLFKGSQNQDSFHRHPILHGVNTKHYSEEHSLILLMSILEIKVFLHFQEYLPKLT